MRTTIRIDEALYRRAKARAAETGRTVSQIIEDAVRESLQTRSRHGADSAPLPTFGGSGVMPGVDVASNAAVREVMDEGVGVDALR